MFQINLVGKSWFINFKLSNKYQRYNDKIKLAKETNSAKYLLVKFVFDFDFEKNIKNLNQEEKSILEITEILDFISLNLKRGICRYVND